MIVGIARLLLLLALLLILALPLFMLFLELFRRIAHQFTLAVDTRPLRLPVVDVKDSSWIEHVAAVTRKHQQSLLLGVTSDILNVEVFAILWRLEIDQGWE